MQQAAAIECVCPAADEEADPGADTGEDGAHEEECSAGRGGQQGNRGVGSDGRVDLAGASEAGQSIVHLCTRLATLAGRYHIHTNLLQGDRSR